MCYVEKDDMHARTFSLLFETNARFLFLSSKGRGGLAPFPFLFSEIANTNNSSLDQTILQENDAAVLVGSAFLPGNQEIHFQFYFADWARSKRLNVMRT